MHVIPARGWCVQIFDVTPNRAAASVAALRDAMPGVQLTSNADDATLVVETPDRDVDLDRVLTIITLADPDAVRAHVARVDPALLTG